MGKSLSKQEKISSSGTVNNNVILTNTDTINVYSQEQTYLLAALVAMTLFQIVVFLYLKHRKHLKNTYMGRTNPA